MNILKFILCCFLIFSSSFAQEVCAPNTLPGNTSQLQDLAKKNTQSDIKKFCEETQKVGAFKLYNLDGEDFKSEEHLQQTLNTDPKLVGAGDWVSALHPDIRIKLRGYQNKLESNELNLSHEQLLDFLSQPDIKLAKYLPIIEHDRDPETDKQRWKEVLEDKTFQNEDFTSMKKYLLALCATYSVSHAKKCEEGLGEILEVMEPKGSLTLLPVIKKVFDDPSYVSGVSAAAVLIHKRVSEKNLEGDVFSDLKESFIKNGKSPEEADDMAWNILGIISARGSNISFLEPFSNRNSYGTYLSLNLISSAMPYLDQLHLNANSKPYSYPTNVSTTCTTGKPYHFWMTAFLSRMVTRKFGDPKAAVFSAYLAEIGHQMRSESDDRDPKRIFTLPSLDPANSKLRIDVAFASAGAVYGASAVSKDVPKPMDVDEALLAMLDASKSKEPISESKAATKWRKLGGWPGYHRWKQIIAPDEALKVMKGSQE